MENVLTAEEIAARPQVRFARGHLKGNTGWTGTVVGYNALYDTYTLYVDAPGNTETGSKITYGRTDVELTSEDKTNARIGHVTDARDTRPVFQLVYRKYSEVRSGCFVAQAKYAEDAVAELAEYLGTSQFVVISGRVI